MKKKIWIINQYATSPDLGAGGRYYYLAKELSANGYEVLLVTASSTHISRVPNDINNVYTRRVVNKIELIYIKTFRYNHSSSKKRIINWLVFAWRVSRLFKFVNTKPDVVIISSPSLISFIGANSLAKRFKSKLIFDVRDLWPMALVEIAGFSNNNLLIKLMQLIENSAYKKSDIVLSSIPYAFEHMVAHGMDRDKFHYLPNGFDKEELINKERLKNSVRDIIPMGKFVVGYIGSLGEVNAIKFLLEAAQLSKHDKSIVFIITGKGSELNNLKMEVKNKKLYNVVFIDQIPKKQVQSMIELFDICYIGWLNKPGYRFGVSPQKIPEYFFSGKPIIHSFSGRGCAIRDAKAGVSIEAENPLEIYNSILILKNMPLLKRKDLGENGRKYSLKHYDYQKIVKKLISVL
jgi:glycosyltransferase involved in cell wall biosynthesis